MGRIVKDILTGSKCNSDDLYCVETTNEDGKIIRKYYTSKEAYEKWRLNNIYRSKCISKMFEILDYSKEAPAPTYLYKRIKEYDSIGFESLYRVLVSIEKNIRYQIEKINFNSETGKISYLMSACSNRIHEEYKKMIKEKKLNAIENTAVNSADKDIVNKKQSVKDIRKWLSEEEYA